MIRIKKNIILAPYTTFKIGGPARFFCEVKTENELKEALEYALDNKLEIFILGGGANILISDKGFDGLVVKIKNQISKIKITSQNSKMLVACWAGDSLANIVGFSAKHGFSGLEWAAGIPGSVGGAIRGNAGAFGSNMSKIIESVKVFDINSLKKIPISKSQYPIKFQIQITNYKKLDCGFDYRDSIFKHNENIIILSCVLKLQKGDKGKIKNKVQEILKERTKGLPKEASAGSFFKNPVVKNSQLIAAFEKDSGVKCEDNKVPAGWLIEEAGLSGKKIGQVKVSEKHANFIINTGGGKAEEVIILVSLIKQKVRRKFNLELEEEVKYVGF